MNLHNEIMNIPISVDRTNWLPLEKNGYAHGHRDARNAAAELSLKAEARIDELESLLSQMIYASIPVSNAAYNLAWQHRDQVSVHENISILDGVRNSAGKLLKEK